jgi:hypothetical protein
MPADILKMPDTKLRLHCAKCGVMTEAKCGCGVGYVTASNAAAAAVKANPEKSDRAIAAEIGVGLGTVQRARKAVDPNGSPEKRTGRDGKNYPAKPKGSKRTRQMPKLDEAVRIIRPLFDAGKPFSERTLTKEHGISHGTLAAAVAYLKGQREASSDPIIDPATLSLSAQEKLAAALRQQKQIHERTFQRRLEEEVSKWIEETTIASYVEEISKIRADIERRTGIMTAANYKLILRCLHPDNSASTRMREEAFVLWEKLRYRFCDNTEMPVPLRGMPETSAGWEALRRARAEARRAKRNGAAMVSR